MFTLETIKLADKKLMEHMGSVKMNKTKNNIIESIYAKIEEFENNLTEEQLEYMNYAYKLRDLKKRHIYAVQERLLEEKSSNITN